MLEFLFRLWFRATSWRAARMQGAAGDLLLARRALHLSSISSGGLDDDFAEELYQLVRRRPKLLDELERQHHGDGWSVRRRRLLIVSLRQALALGADSIY